jgi:hypothetical protein
VPFSLTSCLISCSYKRVSSWSQLPPDCTPTETSLSWQLSLDSTRMYSRGGDSPKRVPDSSRLHEFYESSSI